MHNDISNQTSQGIYFTVINEWLIVFESLWLLTLVYIIKLSEVLLPALDSKQLTS